MSKDITLDRRLSRPRLRHPPLDHATRPGASVHRGAHDQGGAHCGSSIRPAVTAGRDGRVVWIQESTTGWARVKELLAATASSFVLANVLQMPLPPKARRRKTDKVDTARMQREYLNGNLAAGLPASRRVASAPPAGGLPRGAGEPADRVAELDQPLPGPRDLVRPHRPLVAQGTTAAACLRWSSLPRTDALVIGQKLDELARLEEQLDVALTELLAAYQKSPEAQRLDAIRGSMWCRRCRSWPGSARWSGSTSAEALIAFAGLAPGFRSRTRRGGTGASAAAGPIRTCGIT